MRIVVGDILESEEQYIAHQCNCVSRGSVGLARAIFDKFPYSNIYKERTQTKLGNLGDIEVRGHGAEEVMFEGNWVIQRFVINMLAQYYPGKSHYPNEVDGQELRLLSFLECLNKIRMIPGIKSIAFPYKIGCGYAGGDWNQYESLIKSFDDKTDMDVVIYKMEG